MNLHEERLSGKHIFKGRVIDLEVDQIRLPDGHDSIREVINHPGGVAIAGGSTRVSQPPRARATFPNSPRRISFSFRSIIWNLMPRSLK